MEGRKESMGAVLTRFPCFLAHLTGCFDEISSANVPWYKPFTHE